MSRAEKVARRAQVYVGTILNARAKGNSEAASAGLENLAVYLSRVVKAEHEAAVAAEEVGG